MIEGDSKDLVKVRPREIKVDQEANLIKAKGILRRIVGIHQDSISETSPLDRIGEYNIAEVRDAVKTVGENLIVTHNGKRFSRDSNINIAKHGSQGHALLNIHDGFINYKPTGRPDSIDLAFYTNGGGYIT